MELQYIPSEEVPYICVAQIITVEFVEWLCSY